MIPSGKVLSFMDDIDKRNDLEREKDEIRHSLDGKLRYLDRCKQEAKDKCIDAVFSKIYNDATPLSDEYKTAYHDELKDGFRNFIGSKSDKGMDYYIREAIRRSPFAKRVVEAVDDMIEKEYHTKEMNIDNIDPEDLVFKSSDDTTRKLDVITRDLAGDDISEQIKNQVRQTALSEIRRAKEEKEGLKRMEEELAKDPSITTQEAVDNALEMRGVTDRRFYTPSLFEGVTIHKYNELLKSYEEGTYIDTPLYGVMDSYRDAAFSYETESVKDFIMKRTSSLKKKFSMIKNKIKSKIASIKAKLMKKKEAAKNEKKETEVKEAFMIDLQDISDEISKYEEQIWRMEEEFDTKIYVIINKAIGLCKAKGVDPYSDDYKKDPELKAKIEELAEEADKLQEVYYKKIDELYEKMLKADGMSESTDVDTESIMDHAFVEAVKEYTALSMLRALKLESFSYSDVERLADAYAQNL